jgi:hypothetical protein
MEEQLLIFSIFKYFIFLYGSNGIFTYPFLSQDPEHIVLLTFL